MRNSPEKPSRQGGTAVVFCLPPGFLDWREPNWEPRQEIPALNEPQGISAAADLIFCLVSLFCFGFPLSSQFYKKQNSFVFVF